MERTAWPRCIDKTIVEILLNVLDNFLRVSSRIALEGAYILGTASHQPFVPRTNRGLDILKEEPDNSLLIAIRYTHTFPVSDFARLTTIQPNSIVAYFNDGCSVACPPRAIQCVRNPFARQHLR
jgi:hypothetical protein